MVTIRPFRQSDAPRCLELFYDSVHNSAAQYYTEKQLDAWAPADRSSGRWEDCVDRVTFVAEADGVIVGFADITHEGELDHLFVDYRYQRQGIGKKLIDACEQVARDRGITTIITYASALAAPLFRKSGYSKISGVCKEIRGVEFCIEYMEKKL